jgi:anti-anti-sigma regulatory factor
MSDIIHMHSAFHAYLTEDSRKTQTLKEVRKLAFTNYDRDVMIDLSGIDNLNEDQIITLLTIEVLLREIGHQLVLRAVPDKLTATLDSLGLTETLHHGELCIAAQFLASDSCLYESIHTTKQKEHINEFKTNQIRFPSWSRIFQLHGSCTFLRDKGASTVCVL